MKTTRNGDVLYIGRSKYKKVSTTTEDIYRVIATRKSFIVGALFDAGYETRLNFRSDSLQRKYVFGIPDDTLSIGMEDLEIMDNQATWLFFIQTNDKIFICRMSEFNIFTIESYKKVKTYLNT